MRLITSKREMMDYPSYDSGVMCIIAPFYQGKKPLFEGGWLEGALNDEAVLPAFPYMEMTCYTNPLRRTGISDTEATKALVVIDNSTQRMTWEQTNMAGGVLAMLEGAFTDSEGKAFRPNSDPVSLAYAKDRMAMETGMDFKQFPGMNPSMPAFWGKIAEEWGFIGTGDFSGSMGPERSKDIAVGTVNALQQIGDLPVQLHAQDLALQESIAGTVVIALCSAYMGDNVVSWVTDTGEVAYQTVRGTDLVPLNVAVRANRDWRQQDVGRMQAVSQFIAMSRGLPPNVIAVLAKEAGIGVQAVAALAEAMSQMPPQGPPQAPQGAPPQGGPPELSLVGG